MTPPNLQSLPAKLSGQRILILGDVILDEYVWGHVERISPEAPIPVVEIRKRTYRPGGAANVAANVAAMGGRALLGSVIGADVSGKKLVETLATHDVDCTGLIANAKRPTTTKSRVIVQNQQIVRLDEERRNALSVELEDRLLDWMDRVLPEADACVLSDYAKGVVTRRLARAFILKARMANKPVIVDPKKKDLAVYRGATVIKPNTREAERAINKPLPDRTSVLQSCSELTEGLDDDTALLITCGIEGMVLLRPGALPVQMPSVARQVFDVTGAGDTVISVLAVSLAAGVGLEKAVELANAAAGIAVTKIGTSTLTLEELALFTADISSS
jgi:D-glycero-beta-D-manno-heptose-7-phosphate kinase